MSLKINKLDIQDENFQENFKSLMTNDVMQLETVESHVAKIIAKVRQFGDKALINYSNKFDNLNAITAKDFYLCEEEIQKYIKLVSNKTISALETAKIRIKEFHQKQISNSWEFTDKLGNKLGQRVTPISKIGIYVPGGLAAYPSSALMNAIPARVAGVENITMTVPMQDGKLNPAVIAAAKIAGVDNIYTIGGAQAIAALAYGTKSILAVDKIVGPGNIFVTTAKKQVFGKVGIDMIAGPSEILVLADGSVSAKWIAMDLFSQAEHDESAQAILITDNDDYLLAVEEAMNNLIMKLPRKDIISKSISNRGILIKSANKYKTYDLINKIAPEHLQIATKNPRDDLNYIKNAGAIFLGSYAAESLGDYCAGPNHVLPTSQSARFSSPLGVYDFQKKSSIIEISKQGGSELGRIASILAKEEGLDAHAYSADYRT